MINSIFGPVSHHFRDTTTYSLKLFIENCGQTAVDENMVTIIYEFISQKMQTIKNNKNTHYTVSNLENVHTVKPTHILK